ncbi:MAG: hypothetical protein ACYS0G_13630 [Planctomycetota bacterium]|jgi:hypothetical protein
MRRRLLTILIFLLAGAVVNVAVAWGCCYCAPLWPSTQLVPLSDNEAQQLWDRLRPFDWPDDPSMLRGARERGPGFLFLQAYPLQAYPFYDSFILYDRWKPGVDDTLVSEFRFGFPSLCLRYTAWRDGRQQLRRFGALAVADADGLPLLPVWPGFTINTLFYAAILWLLICGPFVLRRFIRVHRGKCPKCGYPVSDSPVCTECGQTLPQFARPAT